MKAIVVDKQGGSFRVSSDVPRPSPGPGEILVKTLAIGINPVDWKQADYGFLVDEYPAVLGTDAASEIIELGPNVTNHKVGDKVYGCTRLGMNKYTAFNEYHLMDDQLAIRFHSKMSNAEGAANGGASLTAGLGVFFGCQVPLLHGESQKSDDKGWALVCGGASTVGMWGIQYFKLAGYKVVATCSSKTVELVKSFGATATVDYRKSEEDQLEQIKELTNNSLSLVLDAVSPKTASLGVRALEASTFDGQKYISGVDVAEVKSSKSEISIKGILLGSLGRDPEINDKLEKLVNMVHMLFEFDQVKSLPITLVGGKVGGWDAVVEGIEISRKGVSGEKLVAIINE